jgi:hypothetical protein
VNEWNGHAGSMKFLIHQMATDNQGNPTNLYATAGYSADYPTLCLITISNPDLGGESEQFLQQTGGSFRLDGGVVNVSLLPASATQWNATANPQGNLSVGPPGTAPSSASSSASTASSTAVTTSTSTAGPVSCGAFSDPSAAEGDPTRFSNITVTGASCATARAVAISAGVAPGSSGAPAAAEGFGCSFPPDSGSLYGQCSNGSVEVDLYTGGG